MTVLEQNPLSFLFSSINKLFSLDSLSLTKRDALNLLVWIAFLSELVEGSCRVSTLRQDKDDWGSIVTVVIDYLHTNRLVNNVHLAKLLMDIVGESKHQLLWSEDLQDKDLLKSI